MAYFDFSNEKFLSLLMVIQEKNANAYKRLMARLKVAPQVAKPVIMLVVGKNEWEAHEAMFNLIAHYELKLEKWADSGRLRVIGRKLPEDAARHPLIGEIDFVLFADEDLLDPEAYPELETIIPFRE